MKQERTVGEWQKWAEKELSLQFSPSEARHQAKLLLEHLAEVPFSQAILFTNKLLEEKVETQLNLLIAEILDGKPVQYILGRTDFAGLEIELLENVLIPRPETEELVNWILNEHPDDIILHDFCTGSGCIALAIKAAKPNSTISASDYSDLSVVQAARNAEKLNLAVKVLKINALEPIGQVVNNTLDIVVSNPPYIPNSEKTLMADNVLKYEPHMALFVDDDKPLVFYDAICKTAQEKLKSKGWLYFEIHENFADEMSDLLLKFGFVNVELKRDMQGKARMIRGQKL